MNVCCCLRLSLSPALASASRYPLTSMGAPVQLLARGDLAPQIREIDLRDPERGPAPSDSAAPIIVDACP